MDYRHEMHEMILNMYYKNPDNNPALIPDWFCSLSIDLTQLLLMTEGVFRVSLYKFKVNGMHVSIAPLERYQHHCMALVDCSNDQLKEAGILKNSPEETDSDFWDNQMDSNMRSLSYRLTILINNINGTHFVYERDSLAEYCLFSERGEFFITYLFYLLKSIIVNGFITEEVSMLDMIQLVNNGYEKINDVFVRRVTILKQLERRERFSHKYYRLEKEAVSFHCWLKDLEDLKEPTLFGFMFHDATEPKSTAAMLIRHMIDILDIISDEYGRRVKWGYDSTFLSTKTNRALYGEINRNVETLRREFNKKGFLKRDWAFDYLNNLGQLECKRQIHSVLTI